MRPLLIALSLGVVIGMSCSFAFTDDVLYSCKTDGDCGGSDFVCTTGICCRATGAEVCGDEIDNDCDGHLDGEGTTEVCNGRDDDCDSFTDEGFDLQRSPTDCGMCGRACDAATQQCTGGMCVRRAESDCANGVDDDQNGQLDCADPGCNLLSCGAGCQCVASAKAEVLCGDGLDADGDGAIDCADSDCNTKSCGDGCSCLGGLPRETNCADQLDNDQDGGADCVDPICVGQLCLTGTSQRCAALSCQCNGGAVIPELGLLCGDGLDNDCDMLTDCGEAACDLQSCSPDGGADCACAGTRKAERSCANLADDDGDTMIDCADVSDCPELTACTAALGSTQRPGLCNALGLCAVEFCFDGADNDGDTNIDCVDSDCDSQSCSPDGGIAPDGGPSCLCAGMAKVEAHCADRRDNDGDGQSDCSDFTDCPQGTACQRNNGNPGICQPNRTCN